MLRVSTWLTVVVVVMGVAGEEEELYDYHPHYHNNYTNTTSMNTTTITTTNVTSSASSRPRITRTNRCDEAKMRCAFREGCMIALQNYMLGCADLMNGDIDYCDEYCRNTLIALTSTEEGRALMNCTCTDDHCLLMKERVEVCREEVLAANADSSVVSCNVAHLICSANTRCNAAISFYDINCRRMFIGKKCNNKCNNSISVLKRQEAAAKLETCTCDGTESFDCAGIKRNMARLCFHQFDEDELEREEEETNEIDTSGVSKARLNSAQGTHCDRHNVLWCTTVVYALIAAVVRWR